MTVSVATPGAPDNAAVWWTDPGETFGPLDTTRDGAWASAEILHFSAGVVGSPAGEPDSDDLVAPIDTAGDDDTDGGRDTPASDSDSPGPTPDATLAVDSQPTETSVLVDSRDISAASTSDSALVVDTRITDTTAPGGHGAHRGHPPDGVTIADNAMLCASDIAAFQARFPACSCSGGTACVP